MAGSAIGQIVALSFLMTQILHVHCSHWDDSEDRPAMDFYDVDALGQVVHPWRFVLHDIPATCVHEQCYACAHFQHADQGKDERHCLIFPALNPALEEWISFPLMVDPPGLAPENFTHIQVDICVEMCTDWEANALRSTPTRPLQRKVLEAACTCTVDASILDGQRVVQAQEFDVDVVVSCRGRGWGSLPPAQSVLHVLLVHPLRPDHKSPARRDSVISGSALRTVSYTFDLSSCADACCVPFSLPPVPVGSYRLHLCLDDNVSAPCDAAAIAFEVIAPTDQHTTCAGTACDAGKTTRAHPERGQALGISGWVGRLGNQLSQLGVAFTVAASQECVTRILLPSALDGSPQCRALNNILELVFGIPDGEIRLHQGVMEHNLEGCPEDLGGQVRFVEGVLGLPVGHGGHGGVPFATYGFAEAWPHFNHTIVHQMFQALLLPSFLRVSPPSPTPAADTLVVHVRSGDVFQREGLDHIMRKGLWQPPLAFYARAIESHRERHPHAAILIITESGSPLQNPCLAPLVEAYAATVQSLSLSQDLRTMAAARHLVLSRSSFALQAALLAPRLLSLHSPALVPARWHAAPFDLLEYEFPGYLEQLQTHAGLGPATWMKAPRIRAFEFEEAVRAPMLHYSPFVIRCRVLGNGPRLAACPSPVADGEG